MIIQEAIKIITSELSKDKSWWESYQENIAMQFYDEYIRHIEKTGKRYVNRKELMKISNTGANNFLKLWCKPSNKEVIMDKVYTLQEALEWFLENHSGNVICVKDGKEKEVWSYRQAENFYKE